MSILNGYMRNKAFPEGSMIESYHTEESVDCYIDYIKDKRATGLSESRHEGRLLRKRTIGRKKFIDEDNQQLEKAHASVLQQLAIVEPFIVQHENEIREENDSRTEDCHQRAKASFPIMVKGTWASISRKFHRRHNVDQVGGWSIKQCDLMASIRN
jgi:hypothetical protein